MYVYGVCVYVYVCVCAHVRASRYSTGVENHLMMNVMRQIHMQLQVHKFHQ